MKSVTPLAAFSLCAVAVAATIGVFKVLPSLQAKSGEAKMAAAGAPPSQGKGAGEALRVTAITVTPAPFAETIMSTGTLRAEEGVELQAEVSGKIVSINFREGSRVKKNDLLVKINDADLQATFQRTVFKRQLAELKERRLLSLLKDGGAKQEDYDAAANELSVQKAEIDLTQAQIAKTEIRAPFDGVIGLRFVSEGSFLTASANNTIRIATIQAIDNLKVDFSIPEKYAGLVRVGGPISFIVVGGERHAVGEIYAIEPRIEIATRTVQIRALCPNPEARLLPGAFANVEVPLSRINDAILVPAVAVVPGLNEKNVFVILNGKSERRPVQTGTRTESSVQILSGLKAGDVVITSGIQQLRAGLPVLLATVSETSASGANGVGSKKPKPVAD